MPSLYEPCGLNQMYSLKYGAVPLVRATGGLADTIIDTHDATLIAGTANGYSFNDYTPQALDESLIALDRRLRGRRTFGADRRNRHGQDWSWNASRSDTWNSIAKRSPAAGRPRTCRFLL